MAEFTDRQGRRWRLAIDGSHVLTAKRTFGINLPGMFAEGSQPLAELVGDFEKFVGVLWILVEEQADKLMVDETDFVSGLAGDAFGRSINAFVEALIDFFPHAAQRAALTEIWQADQGLSTTIMSLMAKTLQDQRITISDSSSVQQSPA